MKYWRQYLGMTGVVILGMGCASSRLANLPPEVSQLPPEFSVSTPKDRQALDYFLLRMKESEEKPNVQWWVQYHRARLWQDDDPDLACATWSELSRTESFPARDIARIRALGVCRPNHPDRPTPLIETPAWLSELSEDMNLKFAERQGDRSGQARGLIAQSKRLLTPDEKTALVERALALAEEAADPELVAEVQRRLEKVAPRYKKDPKTSELFEVATDLRRARKFSEARALYEQLITAPKVASAQKLSAMQGIASSYKNERRPEDHIGALKRIEAYTLKMVKRQKSRRDREYWWRKHVQANVEHARAIWTAGDRESAESLLKKMVSRAKGKTNLASPYWILGRMSEEAGDSDIAATWYARGLLDAGSDSAVAERLRWSLGWNLRRANQPEQALAHFQSGAETAPTEFSRFRFRFWAAKTLEQLQRKDDAKAELEKLSADDPLGYYGILAQRELGQKIRLQRSARSLPKSQLDELLPKEIFEWCLALHEVGVAQRLLDTASAAVVRREKQSDQTGTWTELFRAYARAGSYLRLFEQMGRVTSDQRREILEHHPDLLFPQPYRDLVTTAAEKVQLPPELILSIIRQESSFDPYARSHADAFGLMQILPEVARSTAQVMKASLVNDTDLYAPEVNIPLGAHHLRTLWDSFSGQFIPAVASYNASQKAIRKWLSIHYRGDTLEFIEDIPYEETRGYVRLVIRNLIFYQLLGANVDQIPFPEWVLNLQGEPTGPTADKAAD